MLKWGFLFFRYFYFNIISKGQCFCRSPYIGPACEILINLNTVSDSIFYSSIIGGILLGIIIAYFVYKKPAKTTTGKLK